MLQNALVEVVPMGSKKRVMQQTTKVGVVARYRKTGVTRWDGNPFIEALPEPKENKSEYLTLLENRPPVPKKELLAKGEMVRIAEMKMLKNVIIPYPEYQDACIALTNMIREAYVSRNPLMAIDRARRHAIAAGGSDGIKLPVKWRSTAEGMVMLAVTGMGKTTLYEAILRLYEQVIFHPRLSAGKLKCRQVVYLILSIPHDATLRAFCLQFFVEVDRLLGTRYEDEAKGIRTIAPMVVLMNKVATAISLGLLVIDEAHRLRWAAANNAKYVLNLFTDLIEKLGISVLMVATPALYMVLESNVEHARKLASAGIIFFERMSRGGAQWKDFCDACWPYSFLKSPGPLDKRTLNAWYDVCAGNTAFAVAAFMLAQQHEIGERERVDEDSFKRVLETDLAFLQPAIRALSIGKPEGLRQFEDLLFGERFEALRKMLGVKPAEGKTASIDEFEDMPASQNKRKASGKRAVWDGHLPTENPLDES